MRFSFSIVFPYIFFITIILQAREENILFMCVVAAPEGYKYFSLPELIKLNILDNFLNFLFNLDFKIS